jgi:hypothetical protein
MNNKYQIQNVLESKKHIRKMDSNELENRICDLLNRGFIYNPYDDKFFNPFIDGLNKMTSVSLVNLDWGNFMSLLDSTIKNIKSTINSEEKIIKLYNRETNHFLLDIKLMSGFLGIIFFIISFVTYFFVPMIYVTVISLISFLFIRYYSIWNNLSSEYLGSFLDSPLWMKNKNNFLVLNFITEIFFSFCIYTVLDNFLSTFLIILIIHFISNEIFTRMESKNYFHSSIFDTLYDKEYMTNFRITVENL